MHQDRIQKHSQAWVAFSYVCVALAISMLGYGVLTMPIDTWQRFFLAMGIAMLAQSVIVCTKTIRDNDDADRLVRRLEDAETNKMLRDSSPI